MVFMRLQTSQYGAFDMSTPYDKISRKILFTNEAGNALMIDHDGKYCAINADGELVNDAGLKAMFKRAGFQARIGMVGGKKLAVIKKN